MHVDGGQLWAAWGRSGVVLSKVQQNTPELPKQDPPTCMGFSVTWCSCHAAFTHSLDTRLTLCWKLETETGKWKRPGFEL